MENIISKTQFEKVKWIFAAVLASLLFFHSNAAHSDEKNPLVWQTIQKGTMVSIRSYDKTNDTYHVVVIEEEAVGPLMSASEDVAKAISFANPEQLKRNPAKLVGNQYQLNSELAALSEKGLALRKEEVQKKKSH
jgi:hypothetical protein